jgi:anti-sigma regulatory factor (Ser/Thr protein kinase)
MRSSVTTAEEPTADARFCLVFPRETISVPVMRRIVGEVLDKLGVGEECIADLLLALTEACTNVLRHSGPGFRYEVTVRVAPHSCELEVVDSGRGFDPAALPMYNSRGFYPAGLPRYGLARRSVSRLRRRRAAQEWPFPPSQPARRTRLSRVRREEQRVLAQLPESGRGLAIMRACVDDVTLRSRPGHGTVVSLQKRIALRSDAPLTYPGPGEDAAVGEEVPLRDVG